MKLLTKVSTMAGLGLCAVLGSNSALATVADDIAAAETEAKSNVGLVISAVIGVAALMFGFTYIVRVLSR